MVDRSGWLLDLYEDPLGGLVLWLLSDEGERLRLRQRFPFTFYAAGSPARLDAFRRAVSSQGVPLRTWDDTRQDVFAGRDVPVLAVEVQRPGDLHPLFQRASRAFPDLIFSDADLQASLR